MHIPSAALAALGALPLLAYAVPVTQTADKGKRDWTPTAWLPCADCPSVTVTAPSQLVTAIHKDIKTEMFHVETTGLYTPAHQTSVWTISTPTWVTYEIPCATAYVMPYSQAISPTGTKEVEVVIYMNKDITYNAHELWRPDTPAQTVSVVASPVIAYTPTYATGPNGPVKTHTVKVGGLEGNVLTGAPILKFDPDFIDGKVGDVVAFQFLANNHTVTQADFNTPCVPKAGAFDSGFRPNKENILGQVATTFTIKDDKPAWFYCAQPGNGKPHCQAGMVFAINAKKDGSNTLDNFRKAAMAVPVPGAASTTAPSPVTATSLAPRATHVVNVGGRSDSDPAKPVLKYNPESVIAKVGDIVKFNFLLANHTVTQSSFNDPCNGIPDGFKTGVQSNPGSVDGLIVREFLVIDDKPTWFYCGVGTHCKQGMVFAINPQDRFAAFKDKALASQPKPSPISEPAPKATHYVTVGGLDGWNAVLKYYPETVSAKAGDIVEFDFLANTHSATQSSFENPCEGINGGFKSGPQMNPNNIKGLIIKQFEVKDDKPVWFYSGIASDCQSGMVFAVNPGDKFGAFKDKAIAAPAKATATSTPTYTAAPKTTHYVTVGGLANGSPILKYDPENIYAKAGDIVEFNFLAANHTVTQSSFDDPCNGIVDGFKTGVQSNPNNLKGQIIKQFEVKDDVPAWFYCGVATHCQKGMVFAINPGEGFTAFKDRAIASTPKPDPTTAAPPKATHTITVGGLGSDGKPMLKYSPDNINAAVGDVVKFNFMAANHTVTQSSFNDPCNAIDGGFKSGVRMNPKDEVGKETFEFTVSDDKPIWVYCGVATHCKQGMVFAVNPKDKFTEFKQKALDSTPKPAVTSTATSTATSTTTAAPKATHTVTVGGLGADGKPMLRYSPDNVIANTGDVVKFNFMAANHTVTQSSFDSPCIAIDGGFKSGVRMNPKDEVGKETFEITVGDDKPIWIYCGVATHCQQGMVFAVNPKDRLAAFQENAKKGATATTTSASAMTTM